LKYATTYSQNANLFSEIKTQRQQRQNTGAVSTIQTHSQNSMQ